MSEDSDYGAGYSEGAEKALEEYREKIEKMIQSRERKIELLRAEIVCLGDAIHVVAGR